jgi:hypothetical protein
VKAGGRLKAEALRRVPRRRSRMTDSHEETRIETRTYLQIEELGGKKARTGA